MRQLIQTYRTGKLTLEEVPAPIIRPGGALVQNLYSAVSIGTERASINFAKTNIIGKARKRPDLVQQVIEKTRRDGIFSAYQAASNRLNKPMPLGYSSAGIVLELTDNIENISIGDLVSCAGEGYASHADIIYVPNNLIVKVPQSVSPKEAAFTSIGAIALQGIRRAELTVGERVAVIGLGLIGLITIQILKAYGFPVLGMDINSKQIETAKKLGIHEALLLDNKNPIPEVDSFKNGWADAVIITAATTSTQPIELAGEMIRERGRVIAVGDISMDIPRRIYYKKEADIRISRSTGPGRYDKNYEEFGIDYPIAYARWTEKRNMEEFLRLLSLKLININDLITHTFDISDGQKAYNLVMNNPKDNQFVGVALEYSNQPEKSLKDTIVFHKTNRSTDLSTLNIGVIGAGNHSQNIILPGIQRLKKTRVKAICSATGVNLTNLSNKYGCDYITTNYKEILDDDSIAAVIIATQHSLHSSITIEALQKNKHVLVEKPLAISIKELQDIAKTSQKSDGILMVGFNRRFSDNMTKINEHFNTRKSPLLMNYRINAGELPAESWLLNPLEGGRIVGEVCHFIDLLQFISGSYPIKVYATKSPIITLQNDSNVIVSIDFKDGSRGSINYVTSGPSSIPKEYLEILGDNKGAIIDNFRRFQLYDKNSKKTSRIFSNDKGHYQELASFVNAIFNNTTPPIPLEDSLITTLSTLKILDSLEKSLPVTIRLSELIALKD